MSNRNWIFSFRIWPRKATRIKAHWHSLILLAAFVAAGLVPSQSANAYAFKVLHRFCAKPNCADGGGPLAGLIMDGSGNLFGTTQYGGGANNGGTVFELVLNAATGNYTEKVLHSFCAQTDCPDGLGPQAGLIMDGAGNLFGTTKYGGANGRGIVFELALNAATGKYTEKVLHSFCAQTICPDGSEPQAGLIMDGAGNLYGTTGGGGAYGNGTVFELVRNPDTGGFTEKVLYSFCAKTNCPDGANPLADLIMDGSGNLFGTTYIGGTHAGGTVFELVLNAATGNYTEKVLHSFCAKTNCADGRYPQAGLIMDGAGNLYGTTFWGGRLSSYCQNGNPECGTIFELVRNPATGNYTEKVLHSFCVKASCADGAQPSAGLIMDGSGNLFGTTYIGGTHAGGTVFELVLHAATGNYTEKVLHNFCAKTNCADGANPLAAGLIMDGSGNLFGTTHKGGGATNAGTVFELVND